MQRSLTVIAVACALVVAVLPLLIMVTSSLTQDKALSFEHYRTVFAEPRVIVLFARSLLMAGGAMLLSIVLLFPLALLVDRVPFPGRMLSRMLVIAPLFIPAHIQALTWITLCGEKGWLTLLLMRSFNLNAPPLNLFGVPGATFLLWLSYSPLMTFLLLTGLQAMDRRLEEAALLRHSPFIVFFRITLPLLAPYLVSGAVFVFVFSFFDYGVPSLLRVPAFPVEIFARFSAYYDDAGASALSMPIVIFAFILLAWQQQFANKRAQHTASHGAPSMPLSKRNWQRWFVAIPIWCLICTSLLVPLAVLIFKAGPWVSYKIAWMTSWHDLLTTVAIASVSSCCLCLLALPITRYIQTLSGWKESVAILLTYLPFAFPGALVGIGLIHLWNRPITQVVYGSLAILAIAYIARFLPFALLIVTAGRKHLEPSLLEAAQLCESSPWRRWIRIELPLLKRPLATCWCVVFLFSIGELGTTLLVIPPGAGTISLRIYTLMHYGSGPLVAALALILVAVSLAVTCLFIPARKSLA